MLLVLPQYSVPDALLSVKVTMPSPVQMNVTVSVPAATQDTDVADVTVALIGGGKATNWPGPTELSSSPAAVQLPEIVAAVLTAAAGGVTVITVAAGVAQVSVAVRNDEPVAGAGFCDNVKVTVPLVTQV